MAFKGLVIDYSDTLVAHGKIVPGLAELLEMLQKSGVGVAVVSNNAINSRLLKEAGLSVWVTAKDVGTKKPSKKFITESARRLGVNPADLIYIGDNWKNDALCAANAQILYYHAKWGTGEFKYGILVTSPKALLNIIETFFLPLKGWSWAYDGKDYRKRQISIRSVITSSSDSLYNVAKKVFKTGNATLAQREFFFHTLVTAITFFSNVEKGQIWTTYPSHSKGSTGNEKLNGWLTNYAKEFHCEMRPILLRHTLAPDSSLERWKGGLAVFTDQVNTVSVAPEFKDTIRGKSVVVLDDFTTTGQSLEWARNLLYQAGAKEVTGIALGKIGKTQEIYTTKTDFDPFAPNSLGGKDFHFTSSQTKPLSTAGDFDIAFANWSKRHDGNATTLIKGNRSK
jgi:Haloacid dehalogenase-like hydrolase